MTTLPAAAAPPTAGGSAISSAKPRQMHFGATPSVRPSFPLPSVALLAARLLGYRRCDWAACHCRTGVLAIHALAEARVSNALPSRVTTVAETLKLGGFTGALLAAGVRISMDGRGRWMDNVFVERLWRSLKHEDNYLKGYADGREAKAGIGAYFAFYNGAAFIRRSATAPRWPSGATARRGKPVDMWTCGQRIRVDHMPTGRAETSSRQNSLAA